VNDSNTTSFDSWQKEKEYLDREKAKNPELFTRSPLIDDDQILQSIGIEPEIFGARPLGHIKLFPEDFIVEEIGTDGNHYLIDDRPLMRDVAPEPNQEIRTVWAQMVKMGLDTIEVVNELAPRLGLDKKFIGMAGIKDKHALTAQLLSFRGIAPEKLAEISATNFFLKNIYIGKGALQVGDLAGNRFTIFVRTQEAIDDEKIASRLRDLEENGFWNFFYLQRFGVPRLISHKLGLLILQGRFEDTVKAAICHTGNREIAYTQNFRKSLLPFWGNWTGLLQKTEPLAYTFRNERKMLKYLADYPKDFSGALNQIPEQIKLWVYAYGSFLFNKTLARLIRAGEYVPFELPLALSGNPWANEIYGEYFSSHKISPPFSMLKNFPYVQKPNKNIEVLKKFVLNGVKVVPGGVILDFSLEKASYATTFLSHFFTLSSGQPLPQGISIEEIDAKSLLGAGTIKHLKEGRFKELFEMRKNQPISIVEE